MLLHAARRGIRARADVGTAHEQATGKRLYDVQTTHIVTFSPILMDLTRHPQSAGR